MAKTSFTLQEENVYLELKESDRFVLGIDGTVDGRGFCFLGATKEELERIASLIHSYKETLKLFPAIG